MEDLVKRANKYAKSAGRTGLGHYDAAHKTIQKNKWFIGINVVLSAVVGTSIFTEYVQDYPITTGVVALVSAAFGALVGSSIFADNSGPHRVAGARYGAVRREADMLKLKIQGGDIEREEALLELDILADRLSELAEDSPTTPDNIYYPARDKFDRDHPEYA